MRAKHRAFTVLAACCALNLGIGLTVNCTGQYLAAVTDELGVGMGSFTLYLTIRGLCLALATPLVGRALPRVNIRLLLTASFATVLACTAAMGAFTSLWQWYAAGAVMGFAGAFSYLVVTPVILDNWFVKNTGLAVGVAFLFAGIGGAVFNPVLAHCVAALGWRWAYVINAGVAAVLVLPFTAFVMVYRPEDAGQKPYGHEQRAPGRPKAGPASEGVPLAAALRSASFYCMLAVFGLIAFTACYAQQLAAFARSVGLSAATGGLLTSLCMVGNMVGKLALGQINDRFGAKAMTCIGMGATADGLLVLAAAPSVALVFTGAFFSGVGLSMTAVASPLIARSLFGSRDFGPILSGLSFGQNLISAFGMPIIGFIYDASGSYRSSFVLGAGVCAAAVLLTCVAIARKGRIPVEARASEK